jgi:hypothetical protein
LASAPLICYWADEALKIVPAIAGAAAVAAYVNAKYHVKKDLTQILNLKLAERRVIKAGQLL